MNNLNTEEAVNHHPTLEAKTKIYGETVKQEKKTRKNSMESDLLQKIEGYPIQFELEQNIFEDDLLKKEQNFPTKSHTSSGQAQNIDR